MMEGEKYRPKPEDVQNDLDEATGLLKDKIKIIFSTEIQDLNMIFLCHWKYFYPQEGNIEQIMERDNKLSDLESQATNLG